MVLPLSLPLFPEPSPPIPRASPRTLPKRLWMAVHFPRLPLEALHIPPASRILLALTEDKGRNAHICERTEGAARVGIRIGQTPATALALVPSLKLKSREPA